MAAKDLAQAIRTKSFLQLPDNTLRSNVEQLCTIFQETTDAIITKKLTPLQLEPSPPKDKSTPIDETNDQPRVKDISSDQLNPVSKSTPVEETNDQPRVKDTPNERPEPISTPRMDSI